MPGPNGQPLGIFSDQEFLFVGKGWKIKKDFLS